MDYGRNTFLNRLANERDSELLEVLKRRAALLQRHDDSGINSALRGLFFKDTKEANVDAYEERMHNLTLEGIEQNPSLDGIVADLAKQRTESRFDKLMMRPMEGPPQSWDRLPFFDQARFKRAPRRY